MPASEAIGRTFDPNEPCKLCLAVRRAREKERKSVPATYSTAAARLVLICQRTEPALPAVPRGRRIESAVMSPATRSDPVPHPPPRTGASVRIG